MKGGYSVTLLLGLLGILAAADAEKKAKAKAEKGPADGLAYEEIQKVQVYTDNATAPVHQSPPVEGWWDSKICSGSYCVYTNRRLNKGRGIAAVTRPDEFAKLERLEEHLDRGENKYHDDPVPFTETEVFNKGLGLTANKPIRRGRPLMSWSPILLVHKSLFDEVPKKKDRTRLLEAAASFLPPDTLATFNKFMRPASPTNGKQTSIEALLYAQPFEIDLGYATPRMYNPATGDDEQAGNQPHSKHFAVYPEAARLQHDCRPNVAYYIDRSFSLRTTVARKVQAGEELTVSYVDPFMDRKERETWVARYRGKEGDKKCPCQACSPSGGESKAKKGDKRLKEILEIRKELRNHDSVKPTVPMIERFVKLCEEERLHAKMAETYELAALNFNYLGEDKKAKKYAELAVQAGIVEGGTESNDVVAMRIMAKDVKGHYSYRFTLNRRGL